MTNLIGFGREIVSDLPVVGAVPWNGDSELDAPPLAISTLNGPGSPDLPIYVRRNDALLFTPPGVATFSCRPDAVEVSQQSGCDPAELAALLIATALPAAQWMRGQFMLHASALILPGAIRAVAIAGASGSGKSTIAAELIARGARLLADDSLAIAQSAAGWRASGLPGGLHLIDPASGERRFEPVAPDIALQVAELSAIFVLGDRKAEPEVTRLSKMRAIEALLAMQHRPRVPALLGLRQQVLSLAAGICGGLPVFRMHRSATVAALGQIEWDAMLHCRDEKREQE